MQAKFKFLVLSMALATAMMLPMNANAQRSDDFFRVNDEFGGTRTVTYWTAANGISNNGIGQSEAPVGSGLLILTAAGAGYAVMRRRRNFKKGSTLLLAFALVLGITGCKKNAESISPVLNTVRITLNVDGGSRANVVPEDEFATVTFEEGDVIYVGYNKVCLGSLTYNAENQQFGGDVAFVTPVGDDSPLHFYFLGNKTPDINGTKYTVDIIDQTSKYPVISYNHSNEVYEGAGEYTANLFNYCSFMKFTTDNIADINSQALCITGMNNTVTVDFNDNSFSYGIKVGSDGLIKMPTSTDGTRWAIVLPQNAIEAGVAGSVYIADEYYKGSRPALDEIERNKYLNSGKSLSMDRQGFDLATASYTGTANTIAHIYQSNAGTPTANTITIANGQKVYLHGVNMQASGNAINCLGNAEIVLCGTNYVRSSNSADNTKAIIKAGTYEPTKTTLTISGSGTLDMAMYNKDNSNGSHTGAFIGSDKNGDCGNITITGGTIKINPYIQSIGNSTACSNGALIGAGSAYSGTSRCGNITITGGTVTVDTHKSGGACIGSGTSENDSGYSTCGTITISGGKVTAQSWEGGAAIGSGRESFTNNTTYAAYSRCEGIIIEGTADVTARSTANNSSAANAYAGAAIGAGHCAQVGAITISGGTVTAKMSDYYAPGIGSGKSRSTCGNILINGGTVEATGGQKAAGIGTGYGAYGLVSTCGTITITTGVTEVIATMGYQGKHSIGAGGYYNNANQVSCGTVTIQSGANVTQQ